MRFRDCAVRSLAIAVPMMAIVSVLGGGAYAAAENAGLTAARSIQGTRIASHGPGSQPGASALRWHKLTLLDGWKSSQGVYDTGNPSYAISGGVVYLSGSIHQASGTDNVFAILPAAARPTRWLYLTVYTYFGTSGTLLIRPGGAMSAYSTPSGNATGYTSLAAVSFPTAAIARHKLTLINGWTSSQGTYDTGDPSYAIKGGVVHLSGSLHGGTTTLFAWLPSAARPARVIYRVIYTFAGTSGFLVIYPNGQMLATGGSAAQFTSLAAVTFPTPAITRHKLTLINGWASDQHFYNTGDPSYAVIGGVVYLYGSVQQPSGSSDQFAVLPLAARPAHNLYITVYTGGGNGTLRIEPNGHILAYSSPSAGARVLTVLTTVSYPRPS